MVRRHRAACSPAARRSSRRRSATTSRRRSSAAPHIHARGSGVVDNLADNEEDAFGQIRRFLSYLPSSVYELAPRGETGRPDRRRERRAALARSRATAGASYDARRLIDAVVDEGSFFEIAPATAGRASPGWRASTATRSGVMANDPRALGGATDVAAGEKVDPADAAVRHVPPAARLASPTSPASWSGSSRRSRASSGPAPAWCAIDVPSRMPWITFVHRAGCTASAGQCHHRPTGHVPALRLAVGAAGDRCTSPAGRPPPTAGRSRSADDPEAKQARDRAAPAGPRLAVPHRRGHRPGHHRPGRDPAAAVPSSSRTPSASWPASSDRLPCPTFPDDLPHDDERHRSMPRLRQVRRHETDDELTLRMYDQLFGPDRDPVDRARARRRERRATGGRCSPSSPDVLQHAVRGFALYRSPERKLDPGAARARPDARRLAARQPVRVLPALQVVPHARDERGEDRGDPGAGRRRTSSTTSSGPCSPTPTASSRATGGCPTTLFAILQQHLDDEADPRADLRHGDVRDARHHQSNSTLPNPVMMLR